MQAILGQRFVAPLLDRLLARTAYEGQFSDEPLPEDREDNLHAPVRRDFGAHGRFDAQAHEASVQHWANTHRAALGVGALIALGCFLKIRR